MQTGTVGLPRRSDPRKPSSMRSFIGITCSRVRISSSASIRTGSMSCRPAAWLTVSRPIECESGVGARAMSF